MKLTELKPELIDKSAKAGIYLGFDCPQCRLKGFLESKHRIEIPVSGQRAWVMTASQPMWEMFQDPKWDQISLTPSIAHKTEDADFFKDDEHEPRPCESHFFITAGEIVWA